jgi:hypothetical protein
MSYCRGLVKQYKKIMRQYESNIGCNKVKRAQVDIDAYEIKRDSIESRRRRQLNGGDFRFVR